MSWFSMRVLLRPYRLPLAAVAATSLAAGVVEAVLLVVLAHLAVALSADQADIALALGPLDGRSLPVEVALGAAAALTAARLLLRLGNRWLTSRMTSVALHDLRTSTVDLYLRSSWERKSVQRSGHLQDLLTSFIGQAVTSLAQVAQAIAGAGTFVVLVASAFVLDPRFAALIVVVLVGLFVVLRPVSRLVRLFSERWSAANLRYVNFVTQAIGQAREIQVFGVQAEVAGAARSIDQAVARDRFRASLLAGLAPDLYQSAAAAAVVGGLAVLHLTGTGEFAAAAAVLLLFVRASTYGTQLQRCYQSLQGTAPFVDRLWRGRRELQGAPASSGERRVDVVRELEFDEVSFAYVEGMPALDRVSFRVHRGEMVGIVGPSGAGKSTLLQLLLRLRDPQAGAMLVNGIPAIEIDLADWSRHVAVVPQEPVLFGGTLAENVAFFRPGIGRERIEDAVRRAHLADDVAAMADGLDTFVGDEGRRLSGGQRQRVAIARALASDPDVIVLDEPTSALDHASERAVQRTLEDLRATTLLFVVAHRLSTLTTCDRIMTLEAGVLTGFDTPRGLRASNDYFQAAMEVAATGAGGGSPAP